MKLVELLALELDVWPDLAEWVVQEGDKELYCAWDDKPFWSGGASWRDGENGDGRYFESQEPTVLAEDWKTAIVTRADWQAERERIAGGWIAWGGVECPVAEGVRVDVRYRCGKEDMNSGALETIGCQSQNWLDENHRYDIIAYRLHKPEHTSVEAIDAGIAAAEAGQVKPIEEVKAMYEYNPIHTRNRIIEIDRTTEALEEERVTLVQRLADEGFVLARVDGKVAPDQPVEDMSDWRNWREGDMLVVEDNAPDTHEFKVGELVKFMHHDENHGESAPHCESNYDDWWVLAANLKFHSRRTA